MLPAGLDHRNGRREAQEPLCGQFDPGGERRGHESARHLTPAALTLWGMAWQTVAPHRQMAIPGPALDVHRGGMAQFGASHVPYPEIIRSLLEADQVAAARRLLDIALQQEAAGPALLSLARVLTPPRTKTKPASGIDRGAEFRWLAELAPAHAGEWVAVEGQRRIAHAGTLRELLATLRAVAPATRPLIHHFRQD